MPESLCLFLGDAASPNVERLLENLGWMLSPEWELHLVTSAAEDLPPDSLTNYDVIGGDQGTLGASVRSLHKYLSHHAPGALVQLTDPPVHGSVVSVAGRWHGVPTVYRYAGDRFFEHRVARGRERLVAFGVGSVLGRLPLRLATKFLALGPRGQHQLTSRGVAPTEVTVLPPSVDTGRFEGVSPADGPVLDGPSAIFVGRVSHLKGAQTLERAIPELLAAREGLRFVLVGSAEAELSVPPHLTDRVEFTGRLPATDVPRYMQAADVLIHPSLTDGVPRVLLEALAAGTPVVARDVGDVASVTQNTFDTRSELVDLAADYETLAVDPIDPFRRETLRGRYLEFFDQFR